MCGDPLMDPVRDDEDRGSRSIKGEGNGGSRGMITRERGRHGRRISYGVHGIMGDRIPHG